MNPLSRSLHLKWCRRCLPLSGFGKVCCLQLRRRALNPAIQSLSAHQLSLIARKHTRPRAWLFPHLLWGLEAWKAKEKKKKLSFDLVSFPSVSLSSLYFFFCPPTPTPRVTHFFRRLLLLLLRTIINKAFIKWGLNWCHLGGGLGLWCETSVGPGLVWPLYGSGLNTLTSIFSLFS